MPRTIFPLDKLTKIEKDREIKRQLGEDIEKIEAMGQESDRKAAKWVMEEGKNLRKLRKKHIDEVSSILWSARGKVVTYKARLLEEMKREMAIWEEELPKGYGWFCMGTEKGIVLWFHTPKKEWFAKGLSLAHDPKYDLNGIARMIVGAVELANKQVFTTESGIAVPYK